MGHSRHGLLMLLTAVDLAFRSAVPFAHERAHTSRAQNPGKQSAQEKYRSWCSHSHVENCIFPMRCTNYTTKTPA
jgi:hypothetical protein